MELWSLAFVALHPARNNSPKQHFRLLVGAITPLTLGFVAHMNCLCSDRRANCFSWIILRHLEETVGYPGIFRRMKQVSALTFLSDNGGKNGEMRDSHTF